MSSGNRFASRATRTRAPKRRPAVIPNSTTRISKRLTDESAERRRTSDTTRSSYPGNNSQHRQTVFRSTGLRPAVLGNQTLPAEPGTAERRHLQVRGGNKVQRVMCGIVGISGTDLMDTAAA